jgi:selenide, water dikinase
LRQLPKVAPDPNLLVGAASGDDAGIYRIDRDRALVQTTDFFTPIVDDPFMYGQIAAANSLSDVYAMGGRPLTALNVLGVPTEQVPPSVIGLILRGGLAKAQEARCTIVGGHTIRLPEPIYGMAVTGLVSPRRIIANTNARPGDWLVLTKPLGSGIITTGIKLGITSKALERKAVRIMCHLNRYGAELGERELVRAGTDVTGFGLLGHLAAICRASGVAAEIQPSRVPVIDAGVMDLLKRNCLPGGSRQNLAAANPLTDWGSATPNQKHLLCDAQTSGGLLLCVAQKNLSLVIKLLRKHRAPCVKVIGRLVRAPRPHIRLVETAGFTGLKDD